VEKEEQGYETWMAKSEDLLHWDVMGRLLSQTHQGWDGMQADGGMLLIDPNWNGSQQLEKYDNRYWLSYIGGALPGYEPDPLHIGMATANSIDTAMEFSRFPTPILRMDDEDARPFEAKTLYKSTVIRDPECRLGAPFVMYYNAKRPPCSVEAIGIAISEDMRSWHRYGKDFVVESGLPNTKWNIAGDPQLIRFGELWVMHFFTAWTKDTGGYACDTFAVSRDLVHFTRWDGPPLIEPSEPYDKTFAHKPFVLKHDGVVYHFYCAVGDEGRCLAVATS
jgi:predicted GH43/DUF377 family glycosyl hydrolase